MKPPGIRRALLHFAFQFVARGSHVLTGAGPCCRFAPTCSQYAQDAVERLGWVRGGLLALRRIGRCLPGGGSGFDPVPGQ